MSGVGTFIFGNLDPTPPPTRRSRPDPKLRITYTLIREEPVYRLLGFTVLSGFAEFSGLSGSRDPENQERSRRSLSVAARTTRRVQAPT